MALLAGISYDPSTSASHSLASLLAMTALDTTNLRLTFTAPANGTVLVRMNACTYGGASATQGWMLFGVLDGSTIRGRTVAGGINTGTTPTATTTPCTREASFLVTGLTPSSSYTFDAAYSVEAVIASNVIKYGGPNDTTGDNAFGAFNFEIWETENLLAGKLYDPGTQVEKSCGTLIAMTAFDTTNLRLTFTGPASGKVMWRIMTCTAGNNLHGEILLGILEGSTVIARDAGTMATGQAGRPSSPAIYDLSGIVSVTPSSSYTWDAAYSVEVVSGGGGVRYGGPNDTTADNAVGGFAFEIWRA